MEELQEQTPELIVSVVIVSHNCVEALRPCLAALEASTHRANIEVLVVDNGSNDGGQVIDSEFPDVNMLRLPHFCGMTKARNIGTRTARGEYVLFLAPDIEVEPGTVMRLVDSLKEQASALAVCPTVVDATSGKVVSVTRALPGAEEVAACWEDPARLPASNDFALHDGSAILLRKHTIEGIHYFDQRYGNAWGDVDLAFEIRRAGKKILLLPDILCKRQPAGRVWTPSTNTEKAAFTADAANGAAAYIGKHFGFFAGFSLRIKLVLITLVKVLTFQNSGFNLSLLSRLVSGYKIDGSSQYL